MKQLIFNRVKCWLCVLTLLLVFDAAAVQSDSTYVSFMPGEKLTYRLSWGFIPAGEATLEVMPMTEVNGEVAYHFVMTASTNSFVDVFYKVRDRIDAYTDLGMNHSLLYKKQQREGDTKRDIEILFDWQTNKAVYSNITASEEKIIDLQPGTFDPLSAFYFSRLQALQNEQVVERPVTDGKKNLVGRLSVRKTQNVSVSAGKFKTFLLEPDLKDLGGVFEKDSKAKLKLWVTSDPRHMLVKIKSKVVVGSFVAELIDYSQDIQPDKS